MLTALYLGRECFDSYENKELSNKQSIFEDQYRETLKNNDDNVDYMKQQIISKNLNLLTNILKHIWIIFRSKIIILSEDSIIKNI